MLSYRQKDSTFSTLDSLTEDEQFPRLTKIDADMYCSSMVKRKERQKKKKKERHTVSGTDEDQDPQPNSIRCLVAISLQLVMSTGTAGWTMTDILSS